MVPAIDYFNKPRTSTYFDDLLTNNPDKLFKKYAVHPADSSDNFTVQTQDDDVFKMRIALRVGTSIEAGAVPANKIVAYCHLEKKSRTAPLTTKMEGADCLFLEVTNTPTVGWVPIYYLPWCPAKILDLTIPPLNPLANPAQPNIFFTAAINGCSIFIQGSKKNPTIFHAGGNPVNSAEGRDSAKIWRQLVATLKDPTKGRIKAEINKADHVTEWDLDPTKPRSTQRALDYEGYLKTNYTMPTATIKSVSPWGCVFGVRDNQDNWNFYLQENATITVETITGTNTAVQHRTFGKDKVTTTNVIATQTFARPLALRQIWPNGGGCVKMQAPLPLVLNWSKT
jgi:hypothetical protein